VMVGSTLGQDALVRGGRKGHQLDLPGSNP